MGNCANKTLPEDDDEESFSAKGWRNAYQPLAPNGAFTIHSAYDENDEQFEENEAHEDGASDVSKDWYELPRGGYVVKTSEGLIQFGMPPETIKDSMKLGTEVPTTYVVYGTYYLHTKLHF